MFMKKLFSLVVLVFTFTNLTAQEFSYGILGGVDMYSISTKEGDFTSNQDGHLNLNIGIFGSYRFNEKLSVKLNLLFNSSEENYHVNVRESSGIGGAFYAFDYLGDTYYLVYNLSSNQSQILELSETMNFELKHKKKQIHVSPLLKYNFLRNLGSNKELYLLGGPRVSFLLSANSESMKDTSWQSGDNPFDNEIDDELDVKEFYSSVNLGLQLGAGIKFLKHFSFEVIGDYGFTNILKDNETSAKTLGVYGLLNVDISTLL